ncbi:MAG TPA: DUF4214 domain-containing protein [Usitatibacter sp.]|nr:DUF4214 domain-containing protein [Usitatibacter sp.]
MNPAARHARTSLAVLLVALLSLAASAATPRLAHPNLAGYTFTGATTSQVALKLADRAGRIILGGPFTAVNGVPRNGVVRILPDSTIDMAWNPATPVGAAIVHEEPSGNLLIVTGTRELYRVDGTTGATMTLLVPAVDNINIGAVTTDLPGNIYFALNRFGPFSGVTEAIVRKLTSSGAADGTFEVRLDGQVTCPNIFGIARVTVLHHDQQNRLFVGGDFASGSGGGGGTQSRPGLLMTYTVPLAGGFAGSDPGTGPKLTCVPGPSSIVHDMVSGSDGLLYVAGGFGVKRFDPSVGFTLGYGAGWDLGFPTADPTVHAVALDLERHRIYVAGGFTSAGGQPRPGLAAFSTLPDSALDIAWDPPSDIPQPNRLFLRSGALFAAGFNPENTAPAESIAFAFPRAGTSIAAHYYQSILGRAPDPSGVSFWPGLVHRLAAVGVDPREGYITMAMYFFGSAEFNAAPLSDGDFVERLYLTFFNRASDSSGKSFWMGQLVAGLTRDMVMFAFMFSSEFGTYMTSILGNNAARAEVDVVADFYRGALSRPPEPEGLRAWVNRFRAAQCQSSDAAGAIRQAAWDISGAFFTSGEYWASPPSNAAFVADLYNAFLRRSADPSGFQGWIAALDNGSLTRDDVRYQFLASPEFSARIEAIAAAGCTSPMP